MKTKTISVFAALILGLLGQAVAGIITTRDYSIFLNEVAPSDAHGLYDEAMDGIERFGEDGNYAYILNDAKASLPMSHLNFLDAARYCNWKASWKNSADQNIGTVAAEDAVTENGIYELAGNQVVWVNSKAPYFVDADSSVDVTLASAQEIFSIVNTPTQEGVMKKKSGKGQTGSTLGKIAAAAAVAGGILGGEEVRGNQTAAEEEHIRQLTAVSEKVRQLEADIQTTRALHTRKERERSRFNFWNPFHASFRQELLNEIDAAIFRTRRLGGELQTARSELAQLQQHIGKQGVSLPVPPGARTARAGSAASSDASPTPLTPALMRSRNSSDGSTSKESSPGSTPEKLNKSIIDPAIFENLDTSTLTEELYNQFWSWYDQQKTSQEEVDRLQKAFDAAKKNRETKEFVRDRIFSIRIFKWQEADDAVTVARTQENNLGRQLQLAQQRLTEINRPWDEAKRRLDEAKRRQNELVLLEMKDEPMPGMTATKSSSKEELELAYKKIKKALSGSAVNKKARDFILYQTTSLHEFNWPKFSWAYGIRQEALNNIEHFARTGNWIDYDFVNKPFLSRDAIALNQRAQQAHLELLESIMSYVRQFPKAVIQGKFSNIDFIKTAKKGFRVTKEEENLKVTLSPNEKIQQIQLEFKDAKDYLSWIYQVRKVFLSTIVNFRQNAFCNKELFAENNGYLGVAILKTPTDFENLKFQATVFNVQCIEAAKRLERLRIALLPENELMAEIARIQKLTSQARKAEIFAIAGVKASTITEEEITEAIRLNAEKKEKSAKRAADSPSPPSWQQHTREMSERYVATARRQEQYFNISRQIQQQQNQAFHQQLNMSRQQLNMIKQSWK